MRTFPSSNTTSIALSMKCLEISSICVNVTVSCSSQCTFGNGSRERLFRGLGISFSTRRQSSNWLAYLQWKLGGRGEETEGGDREQRRIQGVPGSMSRSSWTCHGPLETHLLCFSSATPPTSGQCEQDGSQALAQSPFRAPAQIPRRL